MAKKDSTFDKQQAFREGYNMGLKHVHDMLCKQINESSGEGDYYKEQYLKAKSTMRDVLHSVIEHDVYRKKISAYIKAIKECIKRDRNVETRDVANMEDKIFRLVDNLARNKAAYKEFENALNGFTEAFCNYVVNND